MTNFLVKFYSSKKTGVVMVLLASVIALLAIAPFLPSSLQDVFRALRLVFAVGLTGFWRAYSDDVKRPIGKEFLSRAFFITYTFFILILITTLVVRRFPNFK